MKKRSGKSGQAKKNLRVPGQSRSRQFPALHNTVFLVGFMGAGKTSVGRALGQYLNWDFEDLDDRIQRREGRSVAIIFRDSGEQEFRRAEHQALRDVLDDLRAGSVRVIALGGGAFAQENNATLLQLSGVPTVFLDAPVDELWRRCSIQAAESGAERPLLVSPEQFRTLYEDRRQHYSAASITVQTCNREMDAIAAEIVNGLGLKPMRISIEQGEVE